MQDPSDPLRRTTDDMQAQHRELGLTYGSLLWIRSNARAIEVPLSLLSADQRKKLEEYLRYGDLAPVKSDRARLVWEYANQTDGGYLVRVVKLTKEQRDSLAPPTRRAMPPNFQRVDFPALRERLLSGEVSWMDVIATFDSLTYRPWATKEWEERRNKLIKGRCSSCGNAAGPMVLQHTRQPRKPKTIMADYERVHAKEWRAWLSENNPRIDLSQQEKTADACPKCGSQTIRHRWTLKTWVCVAVSAGVQCGHRFRDSVKQVPNSVAHQLREAAVEVEKKRFMEHSGLGQRIALEAIEEMIRYLGMEDTKTFCKPCSFVEDRLKRKY